MMSLTFGLFTQVSGLGPLGPLVYFLTNFMVLYKAVTMKAIFLVFSWISSIYADSLFMAAIYNRNICRKMDSSAIISSGQQSRCLMLQLELRLAQKEITSRTD